MSLPSLAEVSSAHLPSDCEAFAVAEAIENIYRDAKLQVSDETVKCVMSDYLFDPYRDGNLRVEQLSGGQKARLQIIRMLASNPNLLILDEPTNHLDLPSIEELEDTLANYQGAVLYITHDSYFAKNVGDEELWLEATEKQFGKR